MLRLGMFALASMAASKHIELDWTDCSSAASHGKIKTLVTKPDPLQLGATGHVTATGTLDEDLTDGTYNIKVKVLGVNVVDNTASLCKDNSFDIKVLGVKVGHVDVAGMACPLSAGGITLNMDLQLTSAVPAGVGSATIALTATDTNTEELACLNMDAKIVKDSTAEFAEVAAHVNSLQTTWKAKVPKFESFEDVKSLCGTILKGEPSYVPQAVEKKDDSANLVIPDTFDVRTNWQKCASVSGHIRDQSACGSCWAHGSTEAFNDRLCIATGETTLLSTEDTTANCGLLQCMSMGCGGGQPGMAWEWFKNTGVVTGGDHTDIGKGDTCAPYSLPSCQHHNWKPPTPAHPACPANEYSTPAGFSKCKESGYKTSFQQDKAKAASSYGISGVANIQSDIMQYGSVTAAFTVYNDFPAYSSGVYQHKTGSELGGHAVKILGWGTEDGTPFWLVANSWNTDWGDKGFFKILRGSNECGIEGQISAGHAAKSIEIV